MFYLCAYGAQLIDALFLFAFIRVYLRTHDFALVHFLSLIHVSSVLSNYN